MPLFRRALVVGASSGIGRATAHALVAEGHRVVGLARRAYALEEFAMALLELPGQFSAHVGDVTRSTDLEAAIQRCIREFGDEPDLYVFSAGIGMTGSLMQSDETKWEGMFRINVLAMLRSLRIVANRLVSQGGRCTDPARQRRDIVVIGSVTGSVVSEFNSVYGASKFSVSASVEALRQEIGRLGVRVTLLEPGIVRTGYQAASEYDIAEFDAYEGETGPFLSADDVARFIVFAINEQPHVNFSRVVLRPVGQLLP